jgi:hypothetical protein
MVTSPMLTKHSRFRHSGFGSLRGVSEAVQGFIEYSRA